MKKNIYGPQKIIAPYLAVLALVSRGAGAGAGHVVARGAVLAVAVAGAARAPGAGGARRVAVDTAPAWTHACHTWQG